ncbi:hypothetical protein ABZ215_24940 [Amycolatopsis sp. NPDC006131]|uniref:hypothetical protein n=1 Tax=Amycolatopsis sp. NPDC006131 TaxID=3156731 RepID=UPI0033AB4BFB
MGSCVIKGAKDRDIYCVWSSIVEAPTFIGCRVDMLRHLGRGGEERIARADELGTSMVGWVTPGDSPVAHLTGSWDYGGLIVEQRGFLPRDRMADFLVAYSADPEEAYRLLEPFEDDDAGQQEDK